MIYLRISSDAQAARVQTILRDADLGPVVRCKSEGELKQLLLLRAQDSGETQGAILRDAEAMPPAFMNAARFSDDSLWIDAAPPVFLPESGEAPGAALRVDLADPAQLISGADNALARSRQQREIFRLQSELKRAARTAAGRSELSELEFFSFLEREWKRCLRYEWPLALIQVLPQSVSGHAVDAATLKALGRTLEDSVHRPGDALGVITRRGRLTLAATLSETDAAGAEHVCTRMQQMAQRKQSGQLAIGYAVLRPLQTYRMQHGERGEQSSGADLLLDMSDRALELALQRNAGGAAIRWPEDPDERTAIDE